MARKWIQKVVKRKGRVKKYLMRVYGKRAFTEKGTIKTKYLNMAIKRVKKAGNRSLLSALLLAKRLKRMR